VEEGRRREVVEGAARRRSLSGGSAPAVVRGLGEVLQNRWRKGKVMDDSILGEEGGEGGGPGWC
jgi:hypothetical protein